MKHTFYKKTIIILLICNLYNFVHSQNGSKSFTINTTVPKPVHIVETKVKTEKLGNNTFEIWLKNTKTKSLEPYEYSITGTGFFINKDSYTYLVTAKHVADSTSLNTKIVYSLEDNRAKTILLKDIVFNKSKLNWISHSVADISVLRINAQSIENLKQLSTPFNLIEHSRDQPFRESEVYAIGYPLGLGASNIISPITKISKISSLYLRLKPDSGEIFLLDDPSIGGFSGSPIWGIGAVTWGGTKPVNKIIGIVSATVHDNLYGMAVVVPSFYINEILDKF